MQEGHGFWIHVRSQILNSNFKTFLLSLPHELWGLRDKLGNTLLHYACSYMNDDMDALKMLLCSGMIDVNAKNNNGITAAHNAAASRCDSFKLLCAAGANMHMSNGFSSPIQLAFKYNRSENARVAVAYVIRVNSHELPVHLIPYQAYVLKCKSICIILLALKRRRVTTMCLFDRFLLKELCLTIWAAKNIF